MVAPSQPPSQPSQPGGRRPARPPAAPAGLALVGCKFDTCKIDPADRRWLESAAAEIRQRCKQATADLLMIGRLLLQARRRLGKNPYGAWLRLEVGLASRTASRLKAVAKAFGDLKPDVAQQFAPAALYTLSETGVPQTLREYAVQLASDGQRITPAVAQELVAATKEPVKAPINLAKSKSPVRPKVDPEAVFAADNWLLLRHLLIPGATVHITHLVDAENGDPSVHMVYLSPDGKRKDAVRQQLDTAAIELTGAHRKKVCRTCMVPKKFEEFSRLKDSADGRNRSCLACERERVADAAALERGEDGERHRNHS